MTTTKLWPLGTALIALTMLSACGESKRQLAEAQSYSCTQLAREIGKREQRRDSARIDGVLNTITSIATDDKEVRRQADIDSTINTIDEVDAEKSFEQLQEIYRNKGCI